MTFVPKYKKTLYNNYNDNIKNIVDCQGKVTSNNPRISNLKKGSDAKEFNLKQSNETSLSRKKNFNLFNDKNQDTHFSNCIINKFLTAGNSKENEASLKDDTLLTCQSTYGTTEIREKTPTRTINVRKCHKYIKNSKSKLNRKIHSDKKYISISNDLMFPINEINNKTNSPLSEKSLSNVKFEYIDSNLAIFDENQKNIHLKEVKCDKTLKVFNKMISKLKINSSVIGNNIKLKLTKLKLLKPIIERNAKIKLISKKENLDANTTFYNDSELYTSFICKTNPNFPYFGTTSVRFPEKKSYRYPNNEFDLKTKRENKLNKWQFNLFYPPNYLSHVSLSKDEKNMTIPTIINSNSRNYDVSLKNGINHLDSSEDYRNYKSFDENKEPYNLNPKFTSSKSKQIFKNTTKLPLVQNLFELFNQKYTSNNLSQIGPGNFLHIKSNEKLNLKIPIKPIGFNHQILKDI